MTLDHLPVAVAAVRAQCRPDGERPRPSRHFGREAAEHRPVVVAAEIRRRRRERALVQGGIPDERGAAVVRHVEPLVAVEGDGVSPLDPVHEVPGRGRERREETERAVDVEPRAVLLGQIGQLGDRVEPTGVDLARRRAQDRRRSSSPRSAASSASRSSRPVASAANVCTWRRPIPSMARALTALAWT